MNKGSVSRLVALLFGALTFSWMFAFAAQAQTTSPTTKDCADFSTQQDAQAFYDQHKSDTPGNPDPYALDTDGDGKACEGLPSSAASSPSVTTAPSATTAANAQTTIAAASNGQTLPQTTINVASTTGFSSSGTIRVTTSAGVQSVSCTGTTPTSFTGCSGGTGTMSTGGLVQAGSLNPTGAETGVLALSGLSLLETGYGLTLASKRLGIRRRAIPLFLLRKFINATGRGEGGVKVADDVYLVHRSVLEAPPIAPLAPIPEVFEDVEPIAIDRHEIEPIDEIEPVDDFAEHRVAINLADALEEPPSVDDFDDDLDIDHDLIQGVFQPVIETKPEVEELSVPNGSAGQWPNVYAALASGPASRR